MAERITIKVEPSSERSTVLSVEDAFQQVLDAFALLSGTGDGVVWGLVSASTNTPFTAEAEALPTANFPDPSKIARRQKRQFAEALLGVTGGIAPDEWKSGQPNRVALKFFRRNLNGVGRTTVIFDDEPVVITESNAVGAVSALSNAPLFELSLLAEDRSRSEVGSFEGWLLGVDTYYNKPALKLRDRKTKQEVWCRVPEDVRDKVAEAAGLKDVWANKRVRVRGKIRYDDMGRVELVDAHSIKVVEPRPIGEAELRDPDFTDGLTAVEYLRRQREREIG